LGKGKAMDSFFNVLGMGLNVAAISLLISLMIIFTRNWHSRYSLDHQMSGPQKFHTIPVPRIGGIAIFGSILTVVLLDDINHSENSSRLQALKLLLVSAPLFLAGLLEDLTKRASIVLRLFAAMVSALGASLILDATLPRLDLWGMDQIASFIPSVLAGLLAITFTVFAVTGASNSINIIDGFNGLAGGTVTIILGGLACLAWKSGDLLVMNLAMLGVGAAIGFLFLNYPRGSLFLGDAGAYFFGFWMAETAVILVVRNPEISTWQVLAICGYPIIETLFSIYRKMIVRKMNPGLPDSLHFHMLVYRRVVFALCRQDDKRPWLRNSLVAPLITTGVFMNVFLVVTFGSSTFFALMLLALQAWMYIVAYDRMVSRVWHLTPLHLVKMFAMRASLRQSYDDPENTSQKGTVTKYVYPNSATHSAQIPKKEEFPEHV
jgi:UDP-N-acetylmuramyl pentapeptide phosphotransferase/UDP-N-acetylglucosamine-1-phosphate transferase